MWGDFLQPLRGWGRIYPVSIHPALGDPRAPGPISPLHMPWSAGSASRLAAETQVTLRALGTSLERERAATSN